MRGLGVAVAFAILAQPALAQEAGPWPPANHGPSVEAVTWSPQEPPRGQSVQVLARLKDNVDAASVVLRACRVQAYSCLQPVEMGAVDDTGLHQANVPWNAAFFRDVTTVGVSILVRHGNGTDEESPAQDWPARPPGLPAEADAYYYYDLPPPAGTVPAPAVLSVVLGLLAAIAFRRRDA